MTDQPEAIDPDAAMIDAMLAAWFTGDADFERLRKIFSVDMRAVLAVVREREVAPLRAKVGDLTGDFTVALGYLLNARLDIASDCPKAVALKTLDGGIARARASLAATLPLFTPA